MSDTGKEEAAVEPLLTLRVPAQPERLGEIRAAVREAAERCGCSEACARDIVIAVDEACQNIIRHAYCGKPGEIVLEIERSDQCMILRLRDFAPPVDVGKVKPRRLDDVRPGGLGVHFIREVMDESGFEPVPSGEGNLFRMVKRIG